MIDLSSLPIGVQAAVQQHHHGAGAAAPMHGICIHAEKVGECGFAIPATRRILDMLGIERFNQLAKHGDQSDLPDGTGWSGNVVGEILKVEGDRKVQLRDRAINPLSEKPSTNGNFMMAAITRTKAASRNEGGDGTITFEHILTEEYFEAISVSPNNLAELQGELVQAGTVIVQWLESVTVRLEAQRKALAERYAALDNDPIPEEQVWAYADTTDDVKVVHLGEDGDAILQGHGLDPEVVAKALGLDLADLDVEQLTETYAVARPHMPECLDDREPDETCGCIGSDWEWWVSYGKFGKGAIGYFAVTRYDA